MMHNLPCWFLAFVSPLFGANVAPLLYAFPPDSSQSLERTCFQTAVAWREQCNLRSDVAIVYGIDDELPARIQSWRDRGYRIHVMTGVSWGSYQDYLDGRFDGVHHEDEAQTDREGHKISHGGDVYYMCPGTNFGNFLCQGIQRALDAGAEAVHLEEPEFWVRGGYSAGFQREWRSYYGEAWQPPHTSVDSQWRASKLKYFLYRRALEQVFDYVQAYNEHTGRKVRCYVPTHSLLNYAHWHIVSPESSLARLKGCDGYIAQVWTGTSRTPNVYRGQRRERTFETAFLEYGVMQNLVRATGRGVWYLNDPVEDNPEHDWDDYRVNWESTLTASLFQPEVWQYEVAPWPERVFGGKYPNRSNSQERVPIPPDYATELQTVMNALNDMDQKRIEWDCGTTGVGVLVSDSLMFQRGEPVSSDPHLSHVYGLALPLLKRGTPVTPVQLENVTVPNYLDGFRVLVLSYHGQKPLTPEVHQPLADWVRNGGELVVVDNDRDPYNKVREWWNTGSRRDATPREHLFECLGITGNNQPQEAAVTRVGKGGVLWLQEDPARLAANSEGDVRFAAAVKKAVIAGGATWRETNYLLLRRGPYLIGAGLDESVAGPPKTLTGRFVNLFDPQLRVLHAVTLSAGTRYFLLDLNSTRDDSPRVLASACKALPKTNGATNQITLTIEGIAGTPAVVLLHAPTPPAEITFAGQPLKDFTYAPADKLLWLRFTNEANARELTVR
ncbi:MAG: hypothetical protein IT425_07030 [Pirellulales bacterium]|nr:hypothetical protein [Pirellulales bacterium]